MDLNIAPMKFASVTVDDATALIDSPDWIAQQKIDGMRGVLVLGGDAEHPRVLNRRGPHKSAAAAPTVTRMTAAFTQMHRSARQAGDIVAIDGEIMPATMTFHAFDLIRGGGLNEMADYDVRWKVLHAWEKAGRAELPDWFQLVPTATGRTAKWALLAAIREAGGEGIMLKRRHASPYMPDSRVDHALKVKLTNDADVVVLELGRRGRENAVLGLHRKNGTVYEVGQCSMIGKPEVKVGDVVTVRYLYAGAGGRLVQPRLMCVRDDKTPEECTTDQLHFVSKTVVSI